MKIKAILIPFAVFVAVIFPLSQVFTNAVQPPAGRTGCTIGTTETTCGASTCHNNTPNTGGGTVTASFSDPDFKYTPGQTYDMSVSTSESGKIKFGFEITSVDANGDSVGNFIIPSGTTNLSKPTIGAVNHRKYMGHKTASATNSWNFQWKAPAIDKGQLCFFIASNCANGNGMSSGDHIYTTSFCITADSASGIFSHETIANAFSIQSIATNQLTLQYNQQTNDRVLIRLYNLNGEVLQTLFDGNEVQGLQTHSFRLTHSLSSGLYLVRYSSGYADVAKKIFIQK
ncbi:MAG TPA: choice-of-anchor V domain-containing protein [Chitinophagales bacterium]|nr:choice-of-anchor V domain-containing protein [Chitinophagales bacterium]